MWGHGTFFLHINMFNIHTDEYIAEPIRVQYLAQGYSQGSNHKPSVKSHNHPALDPVT